MGSDTSDDMALYEQLAGVAAIDAAAYADDRDDGDHTERVLVHASVKRARTKHRLGCWLLRADQSSSRDEISKTESRVHCLPFALDAAAVATSVGPRGLQCRLLRGGDGQQRRHVQARCALEKFFIFLIFIYIVGYSR